LRHFNFANLPVDFIKQLGSCFLVPGHSCCYRNSCRITVYIT